MPEITPESGNTRLEDAYPQNSMDTIDEPVLSPVGSKPVGFEEDIEPLNKIKLDVDPQKALDTIKGAKEFDVDPELFDKGEELYRLAKLDEETPNKTHPAYARAMAKSTYAAVGMKEDLRQWNTFGNILRTVEMKDYSREANNLNFTKMKNGGKLSDDEQFRLDELGDLMEGLPQVDNFAESIVPEIVGSAYDVVKGMWQSRAGIAKGTVAGVGVGAGLGLIAGPAGILPGMMIGGARGFGLTTAGAMIRDTYEQSSADIYSELRKPVGTGPLVNGAPSITEKDEILAADPLTEKKRRSLAEGGGALIAALDMLPIGYIGRKIPWVKKLVGGKQIAKTFRSIDGVKWKELATSLGKSGLVEGLTEGAQEVTQIVTEEIFKTWDGTEEKFMEGVKNAVSRWETWERAGKAAAIGAIAGPLMEAGGKGIGKVASGVMPGKPIELKSEDPPLPPPPSDVVVNQELTHEDKILKAAEVEGIFEQSVQAVKDTNVNKQLPEEAAKIKQEMMESAGIPHVFVDKDKLNLFADSEEKRDALREELFGAEVESQVDAPIRIDSGKVMSLMEKWPEFQKLIKADPTMGTASDYINRAKEADAKRAALEETIPTMGETQPSPQTPEAILTERKKQSEMHELFINEETVKLNKLKENLVIPEGASSVYKLVEAVGNASHKADGTIDNDSEFMRRFLNYYGQDPETMQWMRDYQKWEVNQLGRPPALDSRVASNIVGILTYGKAKAEVLDNVTTPVRGGGVAIPFQTINITYDKKTKNEVAHIEKLIGYRKERIVELGKPPGQEYRINDEDIFNEDSYHEQPTITEAVEGVVSAAEVLKINEAQINARTEVSESIKADADLQMNKVIDLEAQAAIIAEQEVQKAKAENDPDITLVEDFLNNRIIGELSEDQQKKLNKGQPIFAIAPNTIPESIRSRFVNDPVLKKRKALSIHGVSLIEAMQAFGQSDPVKFLSVLAGAPTREEAVAINLEVNEANIRNEARLANPLEESRVAKAYNNATKNHIREMKILLRDSWSAVKKGIKRIALPLPKVEEIYDKALTKIKTTRVKDLNVNQWKVAERRSQKKAVNHVLKNEIESAFREKHNAAFAAQLAKYTHIAIGKINRANKLIAKLRSPEVQAIIKEAGPEYVKAVNSILSLYNFTRKGFEIEGYRKWAEGKLASGEGDFRIPDDVLQWLTTQSSAGHLTVEQFLYISDKLAEVLHQAKTLNKLLGVYIKSAKEVHMQIIAADVKDQLHDHPDHDPDRPEKFDGPVAQGWDYLMNTGLLFKNMQFIVLKLDKYVLNGYFSQLLYQRLDGTGVHQGESGRFFKVKLQAEMRSRWLNHVKEYGKAEFKKLGITKVDIKEFRTGTLGLNKGRLTKLDLLVLLTHMGNAENRQRMNNFGVTPEVIMEVLKRELTKKEFDFVQKAIWNEHKRNLPRLGALHKRTTGLDLQVTQNLPFDAFDTTFEGGHMPLAYQKDSSVEAQAAEFEALYNSADPSKKHEYIPSPAMEGIVSSPHTKLREGSEWQVSLDADTIVRGFDNVLHDIAMREPVRDVMMILKNKSVREDIIAVLGIKEYETLVSYVAEQAQPPRGPKMFAAADKMLSQIIGHFHTAQVIAQLLGNLNSVAMSILSIPQMYARLGLVNGAKYLPKASMKLGFGYMSRTSNRYVKLARSIDPTIDTFASGSNEFAPTALGDDMPKKRWVPGKPYHLGKSAQERGITIALGNTLGGIDNWNKMVLVVGAYDMFMAGDAEGFSHDTVMRMSPEERHKQASGYAAQLSSSITMAAQNLDKAPIQKLGAVGKIITPFWNEVRQVLNNVMGEGNRIRYGAKEMVKKAKAGDYSGANDAFSDISSIAARRIIITIVSMAITRAILGRSPEKGEDEEVLDDEGKLDLVDFMIHSGTTLEGLGNVAVEGFFANIPGINAYFFGAKYGQGMNFPVITGVSAVADTLYNIGPKYLANVRDEMTLIEAYEELSDKELRSIFNATSAVTKGFPASASMQLIKYLRDPESYSETMLGITADGIKNMIGATTHFINKFDKPETEDERFERESREDEEGKSQIAQAVDQAKDLRDNLLKKLDNDEDPMSDHAYEIFRHAESSGDDNARPYLKNKDGTYQRDENGVRITASSAYGPYQFLEKTWDDIVNKWGGKEAGLTVKGRYSADQQEIAIRIFTKRNAKILREKGVDVNLETLYYAHHFGPDDIEDVYGDQVSSKKKMKFPKNIARANSWTAKTKTAGDRRKWVTEHLKKQDDYLKSR